MVERAHQVKFLLSSEEKAWLDDLASGADQSVAEYMRDVIRAAHAEKERRQRNVETVAVEKLSEEERWLWRRIARGGPLGEPLSIETLDHDSRAEFGDEIVFSRGAMLTRLRESGYVRKVGPYGREYEAVKRPPADKAPRASRGGK